MELFSARNPQWSISSREIIRVSEYKEDIEVLYSLNFQTLSYIITMLKTKSFRLYFYNYFIRYFYFTPKVFASTFVDVDIAENTTWTQSESPYIVNVPITILSGATLPLNLVL